MLFVTHYELVGERSKKKTQELMALFAERGTAPGTVAHYVYADGGAGFVIEDDSSMDRLYEDAINYGAYLQFTTQPIITIDEAVPTLVEWMNS